MPSTPLPENASLEHLKKQAKLVQKLVASNDDGAGDLVREFHPRFTDTALETPPVDFKRADAQLVVARLYGFASWTKLRNHVGLVNDLTRPDPADVDPNEDADRFSALACVSYSGDHDPHARTAVAHEMVDADPDLASASTAAIAVSGHHQAMTELTEQNPDVVNAPCGPNNWLPLLYCCYSRLDQSERRPVDPRHGTHPARRRCGSERRVLVARPRTTVHGAHRSIRSRRSRPTTAPRRLRTRTTPARRGR